MSTDSGRSRRLPHRESPTARERCASTRRSSTEQRHSLPARTNSRVGAAVARAPPASRFTSVYARRSRFQLHSRPPRQRPPGLLTDLQKGPRIITKRLLDVATQVRRHKREQPMYERRCSIPGLERDPATGSQVFDQFANDGGGRAR